MFRERLLDQDRSVTTYNAQSTYGMFLKGNKLTLKNLLFSGGYHRCFDGEFSNAIFRIESSNNKNQSLKDDAVYKLTIDNAMAVNLATNFTVTDAVINSGKKSYLYLL
jgi:hypothetical protein